MDAETERYVMAEMQKRLETEKLIAATRRRPELRAEMYGASLLAIEAATPAEKRIWFRSPRGWVST